MRITSWMALCTPASDRLRSPVASARCSGAPRVACTRIPRIAIPGGGTVSSVPSGITVSIGVAASAGATRDLVEFLAAADHALYQAKNAGRNRVHIISDQASSGPFPRLAATS